MTHHSRHVCFPGVAFLPPRTRTFREVTGTVGVDFDELSYDGSCHTETIRQGLKLFTDNGIDITNPWMPVALVLRTGEAVDAVRNFIASGGAATQIEAAGMLVCGVAQLGGILYLALLIPFLSIVAICATPITAMVMFCVRCSITTASKPRKRRRRRMQTGDLVPTPVAAGGAGAEQQHHLPLHVKPIKMRPLSSVLAERGEEHAALIQ